MTEHSAERGGGTREMPAGPGLGRGGRGPGIPGRGPSRHRPCRGRGEARRTPRDGGWGSTRPKPQPVLGRLSSEFRGHSPIKDPT